VNQRGGRADLLQYCLARFYRIRVTLPAEINNTTKIFEVFTAAKRHIALLCGRKYLKMEAVYSFLALVHISETACR
jgi:hypothetical protein